MSTFDTTPSHSAQSLEHRNHVLDNGLNVVLHRDPSLPLVTVDLWFHVGSKHERPGATGFAHLFEHMLFQGSEHVGTNDHFRLVQQVGGVANGSTSKDRTNYYETLPSHHLDLGLWLESDRMGFFLPAVTQEKLDNQRDVVINERRQRVDNQPYGRAYERLDELLYPEGHPYRWPILGYEEDLNAASLDDVRSFFARHYGPDNAVLVVAGDIDYEQALERCNLYFGDLAASGKPARPQVPAVHMSAPRRERLEDRVQLSRIYMAFHGPGYGQPDWFKADLLAAALADGKSSPLYEDLVYHRQLSQDIAAFVMNTEESAVFYVVSTVRPEVDPEEVENAVLQHLQAASEGLEPIHLERARNQILTEHSSQMQNLDRRAGLLARYATFLGASEQAVDHDRHYRQAQEADLCRFARDFLSPDQRTVVTVVPQGNGPGNGQAANGAGVTS